MIVAPSGPSNGLRTPRGPRQSGQVVSPSRGGIKKRPGPSVRVDKDGDLDMGTTGSGGRGRGRSRGTRGRLGGPHSGNTSHEGARSRQTRTGINPSAMQKAILRGMNSGDAVVRGSRAGISARSALKEACRGERGSGGLHQISVRGWKESKASSNEGGGVKELIEFLERKATVPNSPAHDVVRIKKVCLTSQFAGYRRRSSFVLSGQLSFRANYQNDDRGSRALPLPHIGDLQLQGYMPC